MKHTIAILLQNESGALTRVSSMFSTRGFNIDSLSVAPTKDPMISRLTLVTDVSDEQMDQAVKQLYKLIDVIDVKFKVCFILAIFLVNKITPQGLYFFKKNFSLFDNLIDLIPTINDRRLFIEF